MHDAKFTYRGPEATKQRFDDACDKMRVSRNEVFLALLEFFVAQDELTREAIVRRGSSTRMVAKTKSKGRKGG